MLSAYTDEALYLSIMTDRLKKLYFTLLMPSFIGFVIGYAVKYFYHSMNIPGEVMAFGAPLIFILSAIFALALPIFYRTLFAHHRRHLNGIFPAELFKFERNLIGMAMVTPYLAMVGYLMGLPRFHLAGIILLALYAVYYYYPSKKRIAFEERIFRADRRK
ncbi:MAG: hypothetical protein DRH90_11385 [Deltaproteobacteria bacterium]|nr:MAG: hypothetical protein DRH90_11385 [Deltaproteobacteria bacterium]RLC16639.1 MAG: hypothetical protein DRI24_07950 [Deltaproteobacteria bacterium]